MNSAILKVLLLAALIPPVALSAQNCFISKQGASETYSTGCGNPLSPNTGLSLLDLDGKGQLDVTAFGDLRGATIRVGKNITPIFSGDALLDEDTRIEFPDGGTNFKVETASGTVTYSYSNAAGGSKVDLFNDDIDNCPGTCTFGSPAFSSVAPVTLVAWTTRSIDDRVVLQWQTAAELDNDYFRVSHSSDGVNFQDIATVAGNGTTEAFSEYSYTHTTPAGGRNYYRIVQYDFDGTNSALGVQYVEVTLQQEQELLISPNPVQAGQQLQLHGRELDKAEMSLYSPEGRLILSQPLSGNSFRVPDVRPGIYTLKIGHTSNRLVVVP